MSPLWQCGGLDGDLPFTPEIKQDLPSLCHSVLILVMDKITVCSIEFDPAYIDEVSEGDVPATRIAAVATDLPDLKNRHAASVSSAQRQQLQ